MKNLLFLLIIFAVSCTKPIEQIPAEVPYHREPETPSQDLLIEIATLNDDALDREQCWAEDRTATDYYYLNGEMFSGWTYKEFSNTEHKYRYTKYDKGFKVWQIGYFDNGQLDHDFHMKNGSNHGSQRMWNADGTPYIDHFFSGSKEMDGIQYTWHENGQLARNALFKKGEMIYDV